MYICVHVIHIHISKSSPTKLPLRLLEKKAVKDITNKIRRVPTVAKEEPAVAKDGVSVLFLGPERPKGKNKIDNTNDDNNTKK